MTATDMRTLGRLGEPLRSTPGFRRRRRLGRPVAAVLGIVTVILFWLGITANNQLEEPAPSAAAGASATPARPGAAASRGHDATSAPFATVEGLSLLLPHHAPVAVGYSEAESAEALPLEPVGKLAHDANPAGWTPVADREGPTYHVLAPEGYARPATGAVDVVLPDGGAVLAPVSGRVTAVKEYPLVGGTRDWRVIIAPEGRPDLAVHLHFLADPTVSVGDSVIAGDTPLGTARVLPFTSAIDAVADPGLPRVAMTVKPAGASEAIDPNAPAVPVDGTTAP